MLNPLVGSQMPLSLLASCKSLQDEIASKGFIQAAIDHEAKHAAMRATTTGTLLFDIVVIAASDKIAIIHRLEMEQPLEEIVHQIASLQPVDLVLTEGYKKGPAIKIEVVRDARSEESICQPDELLALVSDAPPKELPKGLPVFALDAADEVADLVESYIVRQRTAHR